LGQQQPERHEGNAADQNTDMGQKEMQVLQEHFLSCEHSVAVRMATAMELYGRPVDSFFDWA
ncbi:MAG: hypothetical protein VX972_00380, partial [Cyanobacteriota bacterium]|nr:hypothetical protein [Cyanobacteriota bacterium]